MAASKAVGSAMAPAAQEMVRADLGAMRGVVVRQDTQLLESLASAAGLPYEARNRYRLSPLPKDAAVARAPGDPARWQPTADDLAGLPMALYAKEESAFLERMLLTACGCGNLRSIKLHFYDGESNELMRIERPFRLGGCLCCPLVSEVLSRRGEAGELVRIGRVRENFDNYPVRCVQFLCCCMGREVVEELDAASGAFTPKYELHTNKACCGPTNNCCGATCLRNDMVFHVTNSADGQPATYLQKTYAGGSDASGGLARCCCMFSNYMLEFPEEASEDQRRLLVAAAMHSEYLFFDKSE